MQFKKKLKKLEKKYNKVVKDLSIIVDAFKGMFPYAYKQAGSHLVIYTILTVMLGLIPFLISWLNSLVIDELVHILSLDVASVTKNLFMLISFSILALLISSLFDSFRTYFNTNLWFTIGREMNQDMTSKYAYLDIESYEDSKKMNLLNKVRENYNHRPQAFTNNVFWGFESFVKVISAIFILIAFKPLFVLILLFTTLPRVTVNLVFGRRSYGIWDAKGDVKRDYWYTNDYLTSENSLMELRIFKAREFLLKRVYDLFYNFQKSQIKVENRRLKLLTGVNLLDVLGYGLVFIILANSVLNKDISLGLFNFYLGSALSLQLSLTSLFSSFSGIYEHGLHVADIFKVMHLPAKVTSGSTVLPYSEQPPLIEFRNVTFSYPGSEKKIFKNLDLKIDPREHIAIVGENGAGKSTLIKLLMRFYDVDSGEILISGVNIKDVEIDSWYSLVGTLFQDFNTYHFDAKTNIGIGLHEDIKDLEKVKKSARKSGAHSFIKDYERGYSQVLSKTFDNGIFPSKGQWQRIALARAFFKDAPILILDEPTSAIDPKAEYEIFERLFEFAKEKSIIIISHRFSTVRNAERIIVLENGKIVEDGSHNSLMRIDNGIYKTAFELQRKGYE